MKATFHCSTLEQVEWAVNFAKDRPGFDVHVVLDFVFLE